MTRSEPRPEDDSIDRAAALIAQALSALTRQPAQDAAAQAAHDELTASRAALEELSHRIEAQLADEKEQRLVLAKQLSTLAGSLDRLVDHLQGISGLMGDLLTRLGDGLTPATAPAVAEPPSDEDAFMPGGEGVSLILGGVPGFQALMEIQKALMATDAVAGASVERFQDGDSRILVHLKTSITGAALAASLRQSTSYAIAVEESLPELARLRLKIIPVS